MPNQENARQTHNASNGPKPGALMVSSMRDGLQPDQEPGIFSWPLPRPCPNSHLCLLYKRKSKMGIEQNRTNVADFAIMIVIMY